MWRAVHGLTTLAVLVRPPVLARGFAAASSKPKARLSSKQKRKRESQRQKRINDLKRKRGLHEAAKWKRILSQTDYWFRDVNLQQDEYLRNVLKRHGGWVPIRELLTFPKFEYWTTASLLVNAFNSSAANRYVVKYPSSSNNNNNNNKRADEEKEKKQTRTGEFFDGDYAMITKDDEWSPSTMMLLESVRRGLAFGAKDEDDRRGHTIAEQAPEKDGGGESILAQNDDALEEESASEEIMGDPKRALVRHRRVGLKDILLMEEQMNTDPVLEEGDEDDDSSEEEVEVPRPLSETKNEKETKRPNYKHYRTGRKVVVLCNAKGLDEFCKQLVDATERGTEQFPDKTKASVIGMDVEYCSLELDIRNTLPAMLQLAAPNEDGPVGLIWLDKFPNHGRDVLTNDDYAPLVRLLADPSIRKVGVRVTMDAQHLAAWWGISDRAFTDHFFSGLVNLDEEEDDRVRGHSLKTMCEKVLKRNLLKLKSGGRKQQTKKRGKKKTAHWRADVLSERMKNYAACDAACGVDVWMALHGFRTE
jgi:hypothetical protein